MVYNFRAYDEENSVILDTVSMRNVWGFIRSSARCEGKPSRWRVYNRKSGQELRFSLDEKGNLTEKPLKIEPLFKPAYL